MEITLFLLWLYIISSSKRKSTIGMIHILLLMVDEAQTSPVSSQVLPLVWNKIGIKGPWGCEFELMVMLQLWIFCTSHKTFPRLTLSYITTLPCTVDCARAGWYRLLEWAQADSRVPCSSVTELKRLPPLEMAIGWELESGFWCSALLLWLLAGWFACKKLYADDRLFQNSLSVRQGTVNKARIRTTGLTEYPL